MAGTGRHHHAFHIPQFPFLQTVSQRNLDNINPAFVLSSGPSVAPIPLTPDAGLGQGVFSADQELGSGYAQQWNLAIQRELSRNLTFEVAYAGSKITHIGIPDTNINQLTVEQLSQDQPSQAGAQSFLRRGSALVLSGRPDNSRRVSS